MAYSLDKLKTVTECDLFNALLSKEQQELDYRKLAEKRSQSSFTENSAELQVELQKVTSDLASCEAIIATLEDGDRKEEEITEKMRLEYRKRTLTVKQKAGGTPALLKKEFDLVCLEKETDEADALLAAVLARKAALM